MTHTREDFLHKYCDDCVTPSNHLGCGAKFTQIFEPVKCPAILQSSHEICLFCLDLIAKKSRHHQFCLFAKHKIKLHVAGWATPASTRVLRSLRKSNSPYLVPLSNLITNLFTELDFKNAVVVPIPLGSKSSWEQWQNTIKNSLFSLGNDVIPLIIRDKQVSTRKNVAQIRHKIANEEYKLSENCVNFLKNRRVVLLDDNVTTGNTIIRCAEMLSNCNPKEIFLFTFDRTISPRAMQRWEIPPVLHCQYKIPITTET